ncbi:hypothetical protein ACFE04_021691 [Oxalis oulophora]
MSNVEASSGFTTHDPTDLDLFAIREIAMRGGYVSLLIDLSNHLNHNVHVINNAREHSYVAWKFRTIAADWSCLSRTGVWRDIPAARIGKRKRKHEDIGLNEKARAPNLFQRSLRRLHIGLNVLFPLQVILDPFWEFKVYFFIEEFQY